MLCRLEGCETNERQEALELPSFDFATVCSATNSFSIDNKIGQGGFGVVYKVRTFSYLSDKKIYKVLIYLLSKVI